MSIGIRGGANILITSSVALSSAGGTTTSMEINLEYASGSFSIQTDVSDATANFDINYLESLDGITYYTPTGGEAGVIVSSATAGGIMSFAPKDCPYMKIYLKNNNATSNLTITKQLLYFSEK